MYNTAFRGLDLDPTLPEDNFITVADIIQEALDGNINVSTADATIYVQQLWSDGFISTYQYEQLLNMASLL